MSKTESSLKVVKESKPINENEFNYGGEIYTVVRDEALITCGQSPSRKTLHAWCENVDGYRFAFDVVWLHNLGVKVEVM